MSKFRLIFVVLFALFFASSVHAADIAVDADCSLADAIIAANRDRAEGSCPAGRGADTIILSQDITLRDELPVITSDITIEGNGYAISGNHRYRIFYNGGGTLTIHDLTMTEGYVEGDIIRNADDTLKSTADQPFGGAIFNWQGTLSIVNSRFSDNLAEYDGGAISNNEGTLSISDSAFSDNSADKRGGAIENDSKNLSIINSTFSDNSASWGGAIYNGRDRLSIINSTFSDNSADEDGGVIFNWGELNIGDSNFSGNSADEDGGVIFNWGELSIGDSSFSGNSAEYDGGAIENWGRVSIRDSSFIDNYDDAIRNNSKLNIINSTFSNNYIANGDAIFSGKDRKLSIINSTFSDNSADWGGTIYNWGDGTLSMVNSIIAGRGGTCVSRSRLLRQSISNFIQDGTCSPAFRGDPMLGKLVVPEDGSPAYFPLLAGSPAIDAADDGYCPETDQIGTERPQGAGCDIGAIEYVSP